VDLFEPKGAWEKPCGGGVPPKVRRLIPEMAQYPGPKNSLSIGEFISPRGRVLRFVSGNPLWILARRDLNGYLLDLARSHKTVRYRRQRVVAVSRQDRGWRIGYGKSGKEVSADFLVAADGASSPVRKAVLGPLGNQNLTACFGFITEQCKDPSVATSQFLAGSGYIWAYPRTDHMCVGAGTWGDARGLEGLVRRFIAQRFGELKILSRWSALIPFIHEPALFDRQCSGTVFAAIGDAAGHVDALTGEGVLYALWGARLLAQSLIEGEPQRFDAAWRDTFGLELQRVAQMSLRFYRPQAMEMLFNLASRSRTLSDFVAQIMTDQPEYQRIPLLFALRIPGVVRDLVRGGS